MHAGVFASLLMVAQLLTGTHVYFACCVFVYVILSVVAFNAVGGLYRPAGSYIFFNSVLGLILSQMVKPLLGEAADTNLFDPNRTITVYLVGSFALLLAALASKRIRPRTSLLAKSDETSKLPQMAMGCFVMGVGTMFLPGGAEGSIASAVRQLGLFLPLSIILATYHTIKTSHGRRSVNWIVILAGGFTFIVGLMGSSKEGIFTPIAAYLLTCAAFRYRFRRIQIVVFVCAGIFAFEYLVPYAQVARNYGMEATTRGGLIATRYALLTDPERVQREYKASAADFISNSKHHYFNVDTKLMERFALISINSELIHYADTVQFRGWHTMLLSIESVMPHFLWKDKPKNDFGNIYAREIGVLGEGDTTTGISFGIYSDGYYIGGWVGILLGVPLLVTLYFFAMDAILPDIRRSPWSIAILISNMHFAPESGLTQMIPVALVTSIKIAITILLARHVLPIIGNLLVGPAAKRIWRVAAPRPIGRRAASLASADGMLRPRAVMPPPVK